MTCVFEFLYFAKNNGYFFTKLKFCAQLSYKFTIYILYKIGRLKSSDIKTLTLYAF